MANVNYLAQSSASYIDNIESHHDSLYTRYFGNNSRQDVSKKFAAIAGAHFSDRFPADCPGQVVCNGNGPVSVVDGKIHFCSIFFDLHSIEALCGTPIDLNFNRAALTFTAFTSLPGLRLGLSAKSSGIGCDSAASLPQETQVENVYNYLVSTQTPHGIPEAHVLTWGHGFCSALLSMSSDPSRVNIYIFLSLQKSTFERHRG